MAVRPRGFPAAAENVRHGDQVVGVYVAVERSADAPELARANDDLRSAGYASGGGSTDINCDSGARDQLGLDPGVDYRAEVVYFRTRQEAQQFVDAFAPGVVGTAEVTLFCRD